MAEVAPPTENSPQTLQVDRGLCDVCNAPTAEVHCKVVCPNCGFTRDCSDP